MVPRRNIRNSSLKMQIFDKVISAGSRGITADDIMIRLPHVRQSTISAQLSEMCKSKMIYDSGEMRATRSGRKARVYVRRIK
jgi:hypothetical protein